MSTTGRYLYFLLFDSIVKIGVTMQPNKRLVSIRKELVNKGFIANEGNCDYLLLIPNSTYELEGNLHRLFNEYHIKSKFYSDEWFRYEGLLKEFVNLYHKIDEETYGIVDIDLLMFKLLKNRLTSYTECVKSTQTHVLTCGNGFIPTITK